MNGLNSPRPVKQRRALLESTPPRDSWIERRRSKTVSTFGEAKTSPKTAMETFISSQSMPYKTHLNLSRRARKSFRDGQHQQIPLKNSLSWYPFFRSKRRSVPSGLGGGALRALLLHACSVADGEILR